MAAPPIPLESSPAAAVALGALYFAITFPGYLLYGFWKYVPYLDSALGAGGKFMGFLFRAIVLEQYRATGTLTRLDVNLYAASTVFITAGMSSCTCALAGVLGDWFQNSNAASRLTFHQQHPKVLPAISKLLSIPVLIFGPGIGVPAAILMYGVRTPEAIEHAQRIRKWSTWGTIACLAVFLLLSLLAVVLAVCKPRDKAGRGNPLVAIVLLCFVLLGISGATRIRSVYDTNIGLTDSLYYTLIVMPEVLQQLIMLVPTLLHRIGRADQYTGWRDMTWAWVGRVYPVSADDEEGGEVSGKVAASKGSFCGGGKASNDVAVTAENCNSWCGPCPLLV
ncbi:hypothetical protein N2152v2_003622 [Parachlorella kessleri]